MEERRGKLWLYGLLPGFAYQLELPVLNIRNGELQKITELCLERSKWAVLHRLVAGRRSHAFGGHWKGNCLT